MPVCKWPGPDPIMLPPLPPKNDDSIWRFIGTVIIIGGSLFAVVATIFGCK